MKIKLSKQSTDFRDAHIPSVCACNIENGPICHVPAFQISYEQLLWSQSCITHICNTELFYAITISARWTTQGLWSTTNCIWWVASQSKTQAGMWCSSWEIYPALQTLLLQGAPSESKLLSLVIVIWLSPVTQPLYNFSHTARAQVREKGKEKH